MEMLRIDKRFLQERLGEGGVPDLATKSELSQQTVRKVIYDGDLASVDTLQRIATAMKVSVLQFLVDDAGRILGRPGQHVHVFTGWHQSSDPAGAPMIHTADLEATWAFQQHPEGMQNVAFTLVTPNAEAAHDCWQRAQRDHIFAVVIGTSKVNPVFDFAYADVRSHFRNFELRFIYPVASTPPPVREALHAGVRLGYVKLADHGIGIECPRLRVFLPRDRPPGRPDVSYKDIAVLAATRQTLVIAGHGPGGTLAAGRLYREHWDRMEKQIHAHGACIIFAQTIVHADQDRRLWASCEGQRVYELTPE
jgi:transcriptional regulator with XRE-family HTH domain